MKIKNKKTGKIIEIDETNPKLLAKYGIKIPKAQNGYLNEDPEFRVGDEGYYEPGGAGYELGSPDNMYNTSRFSAPMFQPVKKQNIGAPEIKGMTNYKQTLETPQINGYDYYNPETGEPNQQQRQSNWQQDNQNYTIPSVSGLSQNFQKIGSGAQKMAKGDWKGAISDWGGTEFELAKGFTNIAVAQKQNPRLQKKAATNFKNAQTQSFLNDYNDSQYGTTNIGMMEDGGIAKYKSINQGGMANVEVEDKETLQLNNGLIDSVYGKTHSEGGIPMVLPEGSKVFSEKLKHPDKKKSFAKLAKKFETKKDFDNLESNISDNINKTTAELNIQFKNKSSEELFAEQESMKIQGVFGEKVKNNTMKDYKMKYGGLTKMDGESGANMTPFESTISSRKKPSWWGDRTKLEEMMSNFEKTSGYSFPYYTPDYDVNKMASDYQKAVINKHPQIVTNLFKNKALPFTNKAVDLYKKQNKTKTTPNETELIKFYNKNPQLITEQFGDDLWGMRGFEMQDLPFNSQEEYAAWKQDKDWIPVGDNYFYDVSGENETPLVYKPKLNYSAQQKAKKPSDPLTIPQSDPIKKGQYNSSGLGTIPVVQPFQEPYLESPVARFTFNPNLIDYRNQNPDFTEIDRQYQGATTGDPRIDANLFAKTLNAKNQIAFGTQAQNRQGQMQTDQFNAQVLDRTQSQQYGENDKYRTLVDQMRGAISTQKLLDKSVGQGNFQKQMDYYNFALPTIDKLYGVNPDESYIKKTDPLAQYNQPSKKFGGKIKLKRKKSLK